MRFLIIGDVVGNSGVNYLQKHLDSIKKLNKIDFVIANGENATPVGKGINREIAKSLYSCGTDVITMGNHTFNNYDINKLFEEDFPIIRPANLPPETAGDGYIITDFFGTKIAVINLLGRVYMECVDCPFRKADAIIEKVREQAGVILVDFHAEATSEKMAMGYYLDGRVSAVFGTHTHVQTADEKILEGKTAFISDVGMTGCHNSILGVKKDIIIKRFLTSLPQRHEIEEGEASMDGVIIDIDETTGKAVSIERIQV